MHDPTARPAPRFGAVVELLAGHGVRWVLTGSCVLAACGAPIAPNDVDVTPDLTPDNLVRLAGALAAVGAVPAHVPGWAGGPTLEACLAWRPAPTEAGLDHLLVTDVGMVDVVPRLCGTYDELLPGATTIEVVGRPIVVCDPGAVLARLEGRSRTKDVARAEVYAALRRQPALAVRPEALAALAARADAPAP